MSAEKLLTADEVAAQLQKSKDWVLAQARSGLFGFKAGRSWRWRQADVDAFIESLAGNQWGLTTRSRRRAS